jgi:hypothetical protein
MLMIAERTLDGIAEFGDREMIMKMEEELGQRSSKTSCVQWTSKRSA